MVFLLFKDVQVLTGAENDVAAISGFEGFDKWSESLEGRLVVELKFSLNRF
jgi:hypothetical protein